MKNIQLLTLIGTAIAGAIFSASSVQALDISLNTHDEIGDTFTYDVTLAAGESLSISDLLALTDLAGVTGVNSTTPYDVSGFDSVSANFLPPISIPSSGSPQTFTNAITLNSSNTIGTINYSANSSLGAFNGTTQGPVAAVPFDPSANLGIFILLGLMGLNHYRKKFR